MITSRYTLILLKTLIGVMALVNGSISQPYQVGQKTYEWSDTQRSRPIKTEIWYPTQDIDEKGERITLLPFVLSPTIRNATFLNDRSPLVLLSHGTGGNRFGLAWLAIALAKQGYIVAAPDHWGNTFDNKIPEFFVRHWERPLDIRFVLDKILEEEEFSKRIDINRIGVAGFSLGGYTALAIAGAEVNCELLRQNAVNKKFRKEMKVPELGDLQKLIQKIDCNEAIVQLKDDRIKAVVALSPALGMAFDSMQQMRTVDIPVLITGIKSDVITPVATNALHYHSLIQHSKYIEIPGKAGHYVMLNEAKTDLKKEAQRYYTDDATIDRQEVHREVIEQVIAFYKINL